MIIREMLSAINIDQTQKPTAADIEMAATIDSAINAFRINRNRSKGIRLPYAEDISIVFGRHRIGLEQSTLSHHIPHHHTNAIFYYDVQDLISPMLRRGVEIGPTGVRYYTVLKKGTESEYLYSSYINPSDKEDLLNSFQNMPKKPGDLRIPKSSTVTTHG